MHHHQNSNMNLNFNTGNETVFNFLETNPSKIYLEGIKIIF